MSLPQTMKVWQYGAISNGIENSLKLCASAPLPKPKPDQHLVKVHYVALNPVDYKPAEVWLFRRIAIPKTATPGIDYSGTIVKPAQGSALKAGDKVFGCGISPFSGNMLAEYAVVGTNSTVAIPHGLNIRDAGSIGVAGLTALQSIQPHISKQGGSNVFLNGGSGGVGVFGIQIAKILGCNVTVTCSGRNAELCRDLGADHVIDYTKTNNIPDALASTKVGKYDHIVDNVGGMYSIYWEAQKYAQPSAKIMSIAGSPSLGYAFSMIKLRLWPAALGGCKQKVMGLFALQDNDQLSQVGQWMADGKIKAVIDSEFAFEDAPQALAKLKTSRARGKIMVKVGEDSM